MLTAFCKEKRNLWVNTWGICFTMLPICAILTSVNGWAGHQVFVAVDTEQQIGNDMTASNYEGTAPTGQTSAQGIPIPGSTLVVGGVPFFRLREVVA